MALTIETLAEAIEDCFDSSSRHVGEHRDAARLLLTAIEQAGYVVVQREPTEEMVDVRPVQGRSNGDWRAQAATDWSAMITATPKIGRAP